MDPETKFYNIYVERIKLNDSFSTLAEAIHILLAAYFTFNMIYAKEAAMTLMLLQQICGLKQLELNFNCLFNFTMIIIGKLDAYKYHSKFQ